MALLSSFMLLIFSFWSVLSSFYHSLMFLAVCEKPCKNGGLCAKPGLCSCKQGWTGLDCSEGTYDLFMIMSAPLQTYCLYSRQCEINWKMNEPTSTTVAIKKRERGIERKKRERNERENARRNDRIRVYILLVLLTMHQLPKDLNI